MIQEQIEEIFSKKHRNEIVLKELISNEWFNPKVTEGTYLIIDYLDKEHNPIKQIRVNTLKNKLKSFDKVYEFVETIFVCTTQTYINIPLISVAAMLAPRLKDMSTKDAIHTMAEILAILSEIDLYDLFKGKNAQVVLRSRVRLSQDIVEELNNLMYLPPMISEPKTVYSTMDSYQYSLPKSSMILGSHLNHHNGDISLDVLNTLSKQELAIDQEFVKLYKPVKPTKTIQKDWDMYMKQSDYVYSILGNNSIYITFKPDKRGRVYAQGHHVNSQGDDFHKAVVELTNKEYVEIN